MTRQNSDPDASTTVPQIAPYGQKRNAPDSIYPLRGADGLTWVERKARKEMAA